MSEKVNLEPGGRYLIDKIYIDGNSYLYGLKEIICLEVSEYAYKVRFAKPEEKKKRAKEIWVLKKWEMSVLEELTKTPVPIV